MSEDKASKPVDKERRKTIKKLVYTAPAVSLISMESLSAPGKSTPACRRANPPWWC